MSTEKNWLNWCPIPPEPPKNRHKKLVAVTLVCIMGFSIFTSLPQLCGFMATQTSGFVALPVTLLSIANAYEGASYIKNATFQSLTETDNLTVAESEQTTNQNQNNSSDVLNFGNMCWHTLEDSGNINASIVNCGNESLTVTSIEIYRGDELFALIDGPFVLDAHSDGVVNFQVCNLVELSKTEEQILTQIKNQPEKSNNIVFAGRVVYGCVIKTSEGVTATFETFLFGTNYFSGTPS
jgi:hypothetical protein